MRFRTLEIRWHDSKPISTCDFQPLSFKKARPAAGQESNYTTQSYRLATGGEDNHVRVSRGVPSCVDYVVCLVEWSGMLVAEGVHDRSRMLSASQEGMVVEEHYTDESTCSVHIGLDGAPTFTTANYHRRRRPQRGWQRSTPSTAS